MTNTLSLGSVFPPSFVGFDRLFNELEHISNRQEPTFPPHNIVKTGDDSYTIELAIAGYKQDDVTIEVEANALTISGAIDRGDDQAEFIHKGISTRKFKRSFTLGDHVKVQGANLEDGILSVYLERIIPEEDKPRKIEIGYKPELLLED